MKKVIIVVVVASFFALAFNSCGGSSKSISTELDSVAYSIGLDLGNHVKTNVDSTLDVSLILAGIKDMTSGKEKITHEDALTFLREYYGVRKPAQAAKAGEEFLLQVEKDNKKAIKTESGLMYEILAEGDNSVKATNDNDVVRVIYEGKLKEGKVFDSSIERGDTAEFPLNRVIRGWTEGMKLVGKGGKIKLWIPSELGYGAQGNQNIGPNEPLVFEVTIVDVIPAKE